MRWRSGCSRHFLTKQIIRREEELVQTEEELRGALGKLEEQRKARVVLLETNHNGCI